MPVVTPSALHVLQCLADEASNGSIKVHLQGLSWVVYQSVLNNAKTITNDIEVMRSTSCQDVVNYLVMRAVKKAGWK